MLEYDEIWMAPSSLFEDIEKRVPSRGAIVEMGSGHGTDRLQQNYTVTSFEHDPGWAARAPSDCVLAPIVANEHAESAGQVGWYDLKMVIPNLPDEIAAVLIDGPPGDIGRMGFLSVLEEIPDSVPIYVDDVHREAEKKLLTRIHEARGGRIETVVQPSEKAGQRAWAVVLPAGVSE